VTLLYLEHAVKKDLVLGRSSSRRARLLWVCSATPPVLMWGYEWFTLTTMHRQIMERGQWRLLRSVVRVPLQIGENRHEYVQRANGIVRGLVDPVSWVHMAERKKFTFAAHYVRHDDLGADLSFPTLRSEAIQRRCLQQQYSDQFYRRGPAHPWAYGHLVTRLEELYFWTLIMFNAQ
jgi:hypothetical protein